MCVKGTVKTYGFCTNEQAISKMLSKRRHKKNDFIVVHFESGKKVYRINVNLHMQIQDHCLFSIHFFFIWRQCNPLHISRFILFLFCSTNSTTRGCVYTTTSYRLNFMKIYWIHLFNIGCNTTI